MFFPKYVVYLRSLPEYQARKARKKERGLNANKSSVLADAMESSEFLSHPLLCYAYQCIDREECVGLVEFGPKSPWEHRRWNAPGFC
jgi:hypothetical protein